MDALESFIASGGVNSAKQPASSNSVASAALFDLSRDDIGQNDRPQDAADRNQQITRLFHQLRPQGGTIVFDKSGAEVPNTPQSDPLEDFIAGGGKATATPGALAPGQNYRSPNPNNPARYTSLYAPEPPGKRALEDFLAERKQSLTPSEALRFAGSMVAAPGAALAAGYEGIWDLVKGIAQGKPASQAAEEAARSVNARQQAVAFEPDTAGGRQLAAAAASPINPFNWIPFAARKAAEAEQAIALKVASGLQADYPGLADKIRQGSALKAAIGEGAINAAPLLLGNMAQLREPVRLGVNAGQTTLGQLSSAAPTEATTAAQRAPAQPVAPLRAVPGEKVSTTPPARVDLGLEVPKAGTPAAVVESEAIKGGVNAAAHQERAGILKRLGITSAWESAIKGDAAEGAVNAQVAKFAEQPAGQAAAAQFAHETEAIKNATAKVATDAGGTLGVGEEANFARGSKIAAVGDKLRQWFDERTQALYKAADERTNGMPSVSPEPIESLLNDRTFKNSVMARDKGHLLTAIEDQLALFKETNTEGLTVKNAEQFRQWLNEQWTPENSAILGKVKGAVDEAVTSAAGEDVYGASRAAHILKKETLENPKGAARIWDSDPRTAINRAVAIEKIPQALERMPVEQFRNVIETLRKKVPPELAADATAAEAEMKAHFVQGILDAGTPNTKTPSPFWNNRKVNDYLAANKEKMSYLFTKEEQARLADIRAGGNIIAVDASYPGAAAQAAMAAKQGLLSKIIGPVAASAGGGTGAFVGSILGMPAQGGMVGAAIGRSAGEKMSAAAAERSALKKVQRRITTLGEIAP